MGCASDRLAMKALFREDPGSQERLHPAQDALDSDPISHPVHESRVVDLIEACLDVPLKHPPVIPCGRCEVVNLGDGVLGSASWAETIGAWLEVRLKNRLEHQLQRGLHDPVCGRRDSERTDLPIRFWDHLLPHPLRNEPASLEVISQLVQQSRSTEHDGAGLHSIDAGGSCTLVAPHPGPCHDEERRVIDEVGEVIEATAGISLRPLVQLRLHHKYPMLGLDEVGPRIADIHRRAPRSAWRLRTRWTPSPCDRLSRPRTTTGPPSHPGGFSRRRAFPPTS